MCCWMMKLRHHACRAQLGRSRIAIASGREQFRVAEVALARWRRCEDRIQAARHDPAARCMDPQDPPPPETTSAGQAAGRMRSVRIGGEGDAGPQCALDTAAKGSVDNAPSTEGDCTVAAVHACSTVTREEAQGIVRPKCRRGKRAAEADGGLRTKGKLTSAQAGRGGGKGEGQSDALRAHGDASRCCQGRGEEPSKRRSGGCHRDGRRGGDYVGRSKHESPCGREERAGQTGLPGTREQGRGRGDRRKRNIEEVLAVEVDCEGAADGAGAADKEADAERAKQAQRARRHSTPPVFNRLSSCKRFAPTMLKCVEDAAASSENRVCVLAEQRVRDALAEISEMKAGAMTVEAAARAHGARAAFLLAFYGRCLAASGRLDLDDLVPLAASLLHDHPAVKKAISECASPLQMPPVCPV